MGRGLTLLLLAVSRVGPALATDVDDVPLASLLDVRVSAPSRYDQPVSRAPASVEVITGAQIRQLGFQTLADLFAAVPGLYVSDDANYSYVGVRGFSRPSDYNNRVSLLIDGQRVNENVYGSAPIGIDLGLDLDAVERIEIVRGPGSVLYGTGAMLAVVDIITHTGHTGQGGSLALEPGSFGRRHGALRAGRVFDSGLDVHVSATWTDITGRDFHFPELAVPGQGDGAARGVDGDRAHGVHATAAYGGLRLQMLLSSRRKVIPTAPYATILNDDRTRTTDGYNFVEARYGRALGYDKGLVLRASYSHYEYRGDYAYDLEDDQTLFSEGSHGRWLGAEAQFHWEPRSNHRLIAGVEAIDNRHADYRSWDLEEELFGGDFPFWTWSAFAQEEYQLSDELGLTVGLRRDESSTAGSATTPRGALVYRPAPSTAVKLLYGEAFRAPNVYEVHYESQDEAIGNPDLGPERIRTVEAVCEQRLRPGVWGAVSAYRFRMRDLIDPVPADGGLLQFRNGSAVTAAGLEAQVRGRTQMGLGITASWAVQRARSGAGTRVTNSPTHIGRLRLTAFDGAFLQPALLARYESGRRTVQQTRTDGYVVVDAVLSTAPRSLGRGGRFRALLRIGNLLDADYRTPGGYEHAQDAIPQMGRNLALRLEAGL